MPWGLVCASVAVVAALTCIAQNAGPPKDAESAAKAAVPAPATQAAGANDQTAHNDSKAGQGALDPANTMRRKQISDDSTKLLSLAISLKTEVDKTNKDMLSLSVIRKADEIEKLAHNVKDKLRLSAGGS